MKKTKKFIFIESVILIFIAVCFILPFLWIVFASFDKEASAFIKLPVVSLINYQKILSNYANVRSFINGLVISLGQSTIGLILSLLASYALSRFKNRYNRFYLYTILFTTGLPITALMLPVYKLFFAFRFINSTPALIIFLAATSLPYSIWMMKNFIDSISIELEEAAWIDGASAWQSLLHVVLPLMLPGFFVVFIFSFSGAWGNFFVPYILLNSAEKMPPAVTIYQYFQSHGEVLYGSLAAFSLLYTIPSIFLYVLSQKYMSKGFIMAGGQKG